MKDMLYVLGCRGSVPRSGAGFEKYGGATSCYALRLGGRLLLVDAGSGMLRLDELLRPGEKEADLFLTHAHADHILGLPMCRAAFDPTFCFHVYLKQRAGLDGKAQLNRFLQPPVWPVDVDGLAARFVFSELPEDALLPGEAPLRARSMEAVHPGGCSVLRFDCAGKSVVFASDCSVLPGNEEALCAFARDADLLLIDGQYSPSEASAKHGFGHNSWSHAAAFGKACGAKKTLLIHHDPYHTDEELDKAAEEVRAISETAGLAYEGETTEL